MEFGELTNVFLKLEDTTKRLEMTDIVAEFIKTVDGEILSTLTYFTRGRVFPLYSDREIGIAEKIMIKALSTVSGVSEKKIEEKIKDTGDLGLTAEQILVNKSQTTLFSRTLTVEDVRKSLTKLSELTGKGSQEKKLGYITELLSSADSASSKYIVRLILGELRLGVGDGIVRDAIAKAFEVDVSLVENAYNLTSDLGKVARTAKLDGEDGLKKIALTPGRPIKVMLAQKKPSIEDAIADVGKAAYEIKYDGARIQIHKRGEEVTLFTRRLENVSRQFPEIVEAAREHIEAKDAIVEGEAVAIQMMGDRTPRPFQDMSRRIKRKYDIEDMVKKIPVEINLFDIVYVNGESLLELPFIERREILKKVVEGTSAFMLAEQLITKNKSRAEDFYKKALALKHEGVMVKVLSAPYQPGSRVGYMYKIKPIMETLDLAVVGATWGEGRRARWIGSYLLAVYEPSTGEYLSIGRMATGLSDEQLDDFTELFKPLILRESGRELEMKPAIVLEVAYEEIQKSPTYASGFALRFPRLVRIRQDRGPEEADTLARIEELMQG